MSRCGLTISRSGNWNKRTGCRETTAKCGAHRCVSLSAGKVSRLGQQLGQLGSDLHVGESSDKRPLSQ